MSDGNGDKLCPVCLAQDPSELMEPVSTSCGHLMCWSCLYASVKNTRQRICPMCKQQVLSITSIFGMGRSRTAEHFDLPPRPLLGATADPFESITFGEEEPPRRSSRHRTTNRRLNDYDEPNEALDLERAAGEGENRSQETDTAGRFQAGVPSAREDNRHFSEFVSQSTSSQSQQLTQAATDEVDFSDDEEEQAREQTENQSQRVQRFKIKEIVPGTDKTHLEIVVLEVEEQMVSNQIKLSHVNWMEVARALRRSPPNIFRGPGSELKSVKSASRICSNAVKKAVKSFKAKCAIMNRTGNSGPPDNDLERSLRTIISVDQSTSGASHRLAPRGRHSRPVILDPQPISSNVVSDSNRSRSPLSAVERAESSSTLNLDQPMAGTYRQQRTRLANEGANIREESLAEMHSRRRPSTSSLRAAGSAVVIGASSTIQAMASQKSNVELLVLNNMELRRQEREEDREERRSNAAMEKEERELKDKSDKEEKERKEKLERDERDRKDKIEKDERERREQREERRLASEREEKDRKDILMFKLIGVDSKKKKYIKVVSVGENPASQPLPAKLNLTNLMALKQDLCEYMSETNIDGIVLVEGSESVILTDIEQLEGNSEKFIITKLVKKEKSYFKLVET